MSRSLALALGLVLASCSADPKDSDTDLPLDTDALDTDVVPEHDTADTGGFDTDLPPPLDTDGLDSGTAPDTDVPDTDVFPTDTDSSALAAACTSSGGTLSTGLCCSSTPDFPNTCAVGACGCAPMYSHAVQICECPQNTCWDGATCR